MYFLLIIFYMLFNIKFKINIKNYLFSNIIKY